MTKRTRGGWLLISIGAFLLSAVWTPAPALARSPGLDPDVPLACNPTWRIAASPNVGSESNSLAAVDAVSATDVWAVGNTESGDTRSTLIEHFDGTRWSVVPSPNGDQPVNWLTGVSAVAANDVWAVGFTNDGNGFESQSFTLILHYDGSSWTVEPSPNPIPDPNPGGYDPSNELYGVHAVSATDVWAVGHTFTVTLEQTLALHWDGAQWTNVPTPHPSRFSRLRSVDASASNDAWAVGEIDRDFKQRTLTQHFDGTSWVTVPSPNEGISVDYMSSVSVAAPNDVWVVGYHIEVIGVDQPYQTSSFHFDGTQWRKVDVPDMSQENNYLRAVATVPGKGAFAVGFWDTGTALRTLAERWTGSAWTVIPSPNRSDLIDELVGIVAAPNGLWAVGDYFGGFSYRTEIQRFC